MDGGAIIATVLVAAVGQFCVLWWRIGRMEGKINGKINGSYFKCPFYKGTHEQSKK